MDGRITVKEHVERHESADRTVNVISFAGASKSYGGIQAVDSLDLPIRRGKIYPNKGRKLC